jgi:hypothetical protein
MKHNFIVIWFDFLEFMHCFTFLKSDRNFPSPRSHSVPRSHKPGPLPVRIADPPLYLRPDVFLCFTPVPRESFVFCTDRFLSIRLRNVQHINTFRLRDQLSHFCSADADTHHVQLIWRPGCIFPQSYADQVIPRQLHEFTSPTT